MSIFIPKRRITNKRASDKPPDKPSDNAPLPRPGNPNFMVPDAVAKKVRRLDLLWGGRGWHPPAAWFPPGCDIRQQLSDGDISNLLELSITADRHRDLFGDLTELFEPGPTGVIYENACRSFADPGTPCKPTWTSLTLIRAIQSMEQLLSSDSPNRPTIRSAPSTPTLSPSSPHKIQTESRDTKARRQGPQENLTISPKEPVTGLQSPSESPVAKPGHAEAVSNGNSSEPTTIALKTEKQLKDGDFLTQDVVRFLQENISRNNEDSVTFLDPQYFDMNTNTGLAKRFDGPDHKEIFDKVRHNKLTFSAVYHPWNRGCWTLLRIRPNNNTGRMYVSHYDPAPRDEVVSRGHRMKEVIEPWVTTNFSEWGLRWDVMDGPRNQCNTQSGVFVMMALMELLSRDCLPSSRWPFVNLRAHIRHCALQPLAGYSADTASRALVSEAYGNDGNNGQGFRGGDVLLSPPAEVTGFTEINGLIQSSVQEPTRLKRQRPGWNVSPPHGEQLDSPTKKRRQSMTPDSALATLQNRGSFYEKMLQMLKSEELSDKAMACNNVIQACEKNIETLRKREEVQKLVHVSMQRKHKNAQKREVNLSQYRDRMLGIDGQDVSQDNESDEECVLEAVEDIQECRAEVKVVLAAHVKKRTERFEETKRSLREVAADVETTRRETEEDLRVIAESKEEMAILVKCKIIKEDLETWSQAVDKMSQVKADNAVEHYHGWFKTK
ncbi:hypothetical protein AK830_g1602 [Neonectria ditissima]|uniref:Ubiquitin-like protease family profile domain-containing protein n=1 Tax=Neonectria ditissima TaxID=78410 RepID=A0A0P7B5Q0_9HYPO|nr:hypothetical protein AK830_g1602 [Neonectria ditissima]